MKATSTKHKKTKNNNKSKISKQDSEKDISTSENINDQSDESSNGWKEKEIETIANTPIFNKNRFYGDGTTTEEFQSSINNSNDNIIIEEEEEDKESDYHFNSNVSSANANFNSSEENVIQRDIPLFNAVDLSSASSINTGDAGPFGDEDFVVISSQSSEKKKRVKKIKKVKKKKANGTNSSSAQLNESESDTLANYSDTKHSNSLEKTPRDNLSRIDSEESNGSKFYFNSEVSDAPAIKRVTKKIDNLISPYQIDPQITQRGIRVRYTDEKSPSPRRRQQYAQIFIEGDSDIIDNPAESDPARYGRLSNEKYPHNITDSEISDISNVDFDAPKSKYLKSPAKDVFNNDPDYAFNKNQMKHENDSISSFSSSFQTREIELENSLGSDDEISNEAYEEAQKKIQKYAIEDNEVQENGALFDIQIPNPDEEGKLLLDLKKNAIMLSSSSSQSSDVEDEDKLEMLGEMVVKRGLPFLKLSDSESEGDPIEINNDAENAESLIQYQDEDSSELPPIQYDALLAPKSLTTPRTPRSPRTPNEPVYTGNYVLKITVIEAIDLPKTTPKLRLEPYVVFRLKGSKEFKRTKTCKYVNPNFSSGASRSSRTSLNSKNSKDLKNTNTYSFDNQELVFTYNPSQQNILAIKIRDEDKFGGDIDLSGYDFLLSHLKVGESSDGWFRLNSLKNTGKGGKLHVRFDLEREIRPEPPHTPRSPKSPKGLNSSNKENEADSQKELDKDFSSISEGFRKRGTNEILIPITDSENDTNLESVSDFQDSPLDSNVLSISCPDCD